MKEVFWIMITILCCDLTMIGVDAKNEWLKFMPIVIFMAIVGCSMIM